MPSSMRWHPAWDCWARRNVAGTYPADGIVLKRTKLGETDLIVTLLCSTNQQVRAVAKGARKPGSRLAGVVNLGNEVSLLLHRGRSLDVITEGRLTTSRAVLACEVERCVMAEVVLDCASELTAEGECDPRLLPLTGAALDALGSASLERLALVGGAYVFKAAAMQGYRPVLDSCVGCGDALEATQGRVLFSVEEGGVVCGGCAADANGTYVDAALLGWVRILLSMRFSELLALDPFIGESALGLDVLDLARLWLAHYPGVQPRALDFALGAGLY